MCFLYNVLNIIILNLSTIVQKNYPVPSGMGVTMMELMTLFSLFSFYIIFKHYLYAVLENLTSQRLSV